MRTGMMALLAFTASVTLTRAGVLMDINQIGPDVVVGVSGSVNTTGLTSIGSGFLSIVLKAADAQLIVGSTQGGMVTSYWGLTGPGNFGNGDFFIPTSGTGDMAFIYGSNGMLGVPGGYVSGAPLSSSVTFVGKDLTSLGLKPGSYVWTWGSGPNADSFTVNIAVVPEPGHYAIAVGLGLMGMGLWRRHARK